MKYNRFYFSTESLTRKIGLGLPYSFHKLEAPQIAKYSAAIVPVVPTTKNAAGLKITSGGKLRTL